MELNDTRKLLDSVSFEDIDKGKFFRKDGEKFEMPIFKALFRQIKTNGGFKQWLDGLDNKLLEKYVIHCIKEEEKNKSGDKNNKPDEKSLDIFTTAISIRSCCKNFPKNFGGKLDTTQDELHTYLFFTTWIIKATYVDRILLESCTEDGLSPYSVKVLAPLNFDIAKIEISKTAMEGVDLFCDCFREGTSVEDVKQIVKIVAKISENNVV